MVTVWHQAKAKVNRLLSNARPEARTTHESTCRVPYETVEMIIAHLTYDLDTLKACSLTCRSWYIVAAPHLHHTFSLTLSGDKLEPLSKLHELGLIPLAKKLRVVSEWSWNMNRRWFVPEAFSPDDLRYFSAFTNVHTLDLRGVEIYYFIPGIERYFEHFSPTLRSITLYDPCCTPRQLSYFLSFFSNLEDIKIWRILPNVNTAFPDRELVPSSAPQLRGQLTLHDCNCAETWTYLITWCGGLRFRHMNLRWCITCAPVLFEACAETLETLRFSATDGSIGK
jgi:hypothetical protein